jgi:hypothetical protein
MLICQSVHKWNLQAVRNRKALFMYEMLNSCTKSCFVKNSAGSEHVSTLFKKRTDAQKSVAGSAIFLFLWYTDIHFLRRCEIVHIFLPLRQTNATGVKT